MPLLPGGTLARLLSAQPGKVRRWHSNARGCHTLPLCTLAPPVCTFATLRLFAPCTATLHLGTA
eukprot:6143577-Prymnesium_polylepis.1